MYTIYRTIRNQVKNYNKIETNLFVSNYRDLSKLGINSIYFRSLNKDLFDF